MVPHPARLSPRPGAPGPTTSIAPGSFVGVQPAFPHPDAAKILASLKHSILANDLDLVVLLDAISDAARHLTSADGVALALRRNGVVVCRSRSGDPAPELGAQLHVDSGISGEALRTGRTLRCDDTERDWRADPEVCRRLGLRSIAVVPLRGRHGAMGVLEAFSRHPCAFAEEHVAALEQLADLAEEARSHRSQPPAAVAAQAPASWRSAAAAWLARQWPKTPSRATAGAMAALLILSLSWLALRRPAISPTPVAQAAPPSAASNSSEVGAAVTAWKPSPGRAKNPRSGTASPAVQLAAGLEPESTQNPQLSSSAGKPGPGSVLLTPISILSSPPSGAIQGKLLYRTQPVYPAQALAARLEGPVVLQGVIAEDGRIRELKVVSGEPLLTQSAINALSQWVYQPYRLDGKPVSVPTEITVSFQLP